MLWFGSPLRHHVEQCEAETGPEREGKAQRALYCRANQKNKMRKSNNEMTLIYWRDSVTPVGPLALLYARIHHSIHPPPNGDVRITTPKLSTSERKLMAAVMRFKPADVTETGSTCTWSTGTVLTGIEWMGTESMSTQFANISMGVQSVCMQRTADVRLLDLMLMGLTGLGLTEMTLGCISETRSGSMGTALANAGSGPIRGGAARAGSTGMRVVGADAVGLLGAALADLV